MGWFDTKNHTENQLEIYIEILNEKTEELEELESAEGNTAIDAHRAQLQEQIQQVQLNIEKTQEGAERAGEDVGRYERDQNLFED